VTISKFYLYFFFLTLPFIGGFIPVAKGMEGLSSDLIFLSVFPIILISLIIKITVAGKKRPNLSKIAIWFFLYHTYIFLNAMVQQTELRESLYIGAISVLAFLILIDNLEYTERDFAIFNNILLIVGMGTFVVSFIQFTIDPFFYKGVRPEVVRSFSGYYRNSSIFTGIGNNEGGIAIICLVIYFLFCNYYKISLKYLILTAMLFFSAFVTFSRYIWLAPIISLPIFLGTKYRKSVRLSIFCFAIFLLIIVYWLFFPAVTDSVIYQDRLLDKTIDARTESSYLFFKDYFFTSPIFGYGKSSWDSDSFLSAFGHDMGIHVGWLDIIFRGGLVGLFLYCVFICQIYKKGLEIFRKTRNPIFFLFIAVFILINFTAVLIDISYYGYYFMLFYLFLYYKLFVEKPLLVKQQMSLNNAAKRNV